MIYTLYFKDKALKDIAYHKKSGNTILLKKLQGLLQELETQPYEGTGQPEPLKYELSGLWSRRLNREHRLIYQVEETTREIDILSLRGHY